MVDRGRGDPRNLMGVIIDRDDNDMYRIAVRAEVLHGKYSRNQFELCIHKLLQITDVSTDEEVALFRYSRCVVDRFTRNATVLVAASVSRTDANALG